MLVRFSIENCLSFRERQTLNLTAVPSCKERQNENVFMAGGEHLLSSAVLYGANASGKSNFFHALAFFRYFIISSATEFNISDPIPVWPFLLDEDGNHRPVQFEIEFILKDQKYRYGFQTTEKEVAGEWLYRGKKLLFLRARTEGEDTIQVEKDWKTARGLEERTRENALFLTVCGQFAVPEAERIIRYFHENFHIVSGAIPYQLKHFTSSQLASNGAYCDDIISFLKNADTDIQGLKVQEQELTEPSGGQRRYFDIRSLHNVYDQDGQVCRQIAFPFDAMESLGTRKAYALAGPIVDTLRSGDVLVVDELDSRLHPIFTRQIIRLFSSPETNPHHAQLIFNTHDTNLLSYKIFNPETEKEENLFRRDQIYFTEKDHREGSHLYSLIEFKKQDSRKIRNDASFEKDYLNGVYGAIPFIGELLDPGEKR